MIYQSCCKKKKKFQSVTGENILITFAPAGDRTCDPPHKSPILYRVAIKAGLYRKAVQVFIIPNTTTYSSSIFGSPEQRSRRAIVLPRRRR